jgi:predicted O-methyltransferase YrrM
MGHQRMGGGTMSKEPYEEQISQVDSEIEGLIDVLVTAGVTRFLEVGSRYGGSLWRIANALPKGSLVVSVDSGSGMGGKKPGQQLSLSRCILALKARGYNAHLIIGDSQLPEAIEKVAKFAPFDACLIDADHELKGVTKDWENYGPMCRLVAFHDVAWQKPEGYAQAKLVEVPVLWSQLKDTYHRTKEFIDRSTGGNMGIGVLWRS